MSLHNMLSQADYQYRIKDTANWVSKAWKASLNNDELTRLNNFKFAPTIPRMGDVDSERAYKTEMMNREMMAKTIMSQLAISTINAKTGVDLGKMGTYTHADLAKASGVYSTLGYNFYDLRAPVELLYPVNVPLRNSIKRVGKVNAGYGTAAHWMATRNPGILYAGIVEGQRAPIATPDQNSYTATYKEIGVDRAATFTAEFASEGFTDVLADEHLRGLHELWLQEESLIWSGNSGTGAGNNGFALGTCPTPTTVVSATANYTANQTTGNLSIGMPPYTTAFTTASFVTVYCVALTALGNPANAQYGYQAAPTIASGLNPVFTRTNADGSSQQVFGGMSAVSVASNTTQCTTGNLVIYAAMPKASLPMKGVFGYAWFVDTETSSTTSLANAFFAGVTQTPYAYIRGTATGSQTAAAANLNVDHSYQTTDFDGLLTYAVNTAGAYWNDLSANTIVAGSGNNSFTSGKNGTVNEIETALQYIYQNFQCGVDEIWGDSSAIIALSNAVRWSGTNASGFQFVYTKDSQNNILGGFVISAYQSRFATNNPTGANAISLRIHPQMPPGTIYFRLTNNPYPHSRAPYMEGMLVQRDYYSIEWPLTTRQWTFGTYVHEVLQHHMPFIPGVITGIGPFVAN